MYEQNTVNDWIYVIIVSCNILYGAKFYDRENIDEFDAFSHSL